MSNSIVSDPLVDVSTLFAFVILSISLPAKSKPPADVSFSFRHAGAALCQFISRPI
jgi:hypothetical protein